MCINGVRVPVIGRVAMQMTCVDLTDLAETPAPGDAVYVLGGPGNAVSAQELADWWGNHSLRSDLPARQEQNRRITHKGAAAPFSFAFRRTKPGGRSCRAPQKENAASAPTEDPAFLRRNCRRVCGQRSTALFRPQAKASPLSADCLPFPVSATGVSAARRRSPLKRLPVRSTSLPARRAPSCRKKRKKSRRSSAPAAFSEISVKRSDF